MFRPKTITIQHSIDPALMALLRTIAAGFNHDQLDRIERKLQAMREDLKQYFDDTKAAYAAFATALDNIQGDLTTLNTKIAALEAAQAAGGELTADEKATMADLKDAAAKIVTRVQSIADETPEVPAPPTV